MKMKIKKPLLLLLLLVAPCSMLLLTGCNTVRQTASQKTTNPTTGVIDERTVEAKISGTGDAKSAVEKLNGSASLKTVRLGAQGVSEESNVTEMIKAVGDLLEKLFNAGVAAGAKTVKP
jgi:hypothetical protein